MADFALANADQYFSEIRKHKNIVLFGCGGKGREAVPILKAHGIKISAACDNNQALWGRKFLDEYVIQGFDSEIAALEDCCVIITATIIYATEIQREIQKSCPQIPVYHLCTPFKVESGLLPESELQAHRAELAEAYDLFQDDESKSIFLDTLNWKLTGNMLPLIKYDLGYEVYSFFDERFIHTDEKSVYVDVGAYTGDTIVCFLMFSRGRFKKIIGVEADRGNYSALSQMVQFSRVEHIETYNLGLWSREEERAFYTNSANEEIHFGSPNLFRSVDVVADNHSLEQMKDKLTENVLRLKTLDGLLKNEVPTIMKINALAADREIILGGRHIMARYKPALMLEFGVTQRDVFEMIPLLREINSKYRFYMRRKRVFEDIKTVLYCV